MVSPRLPRAHLAEVLTETRQRARRDACHEHADCPHPGDQGINEVPMEQWNSYEPILDNKAPKQMYKGDSSGKTVVEEGSEAVYWNQMNQAECSTRMQLNGEKVESVTSIQQRQDLKKGDDEHL